jgi:uncharacterized protein with PQ loop repeat
MKSLKSKMTEKEVLVILYSAAFAMFLFSMHAISINDIWGFLSSLGTSLVLALGPKDPDFYRSPIKKLDDLNNISYSTDALSGAITSVAFIFIVIGLIGKLFF